MSSDVNDSSGTLHPLEVGTRVVYDPPSVHLDNREGTIESFDNDNWGVLYVIEDSEEEFPISIDESSIVRTLEADTERSATEGKSDQ